MANAFLVSTRTNHHHNKNNFRRGRFHYSLGNECNSRGHQQSCSVFSSCRRSSALFSTTTTPTTKKSQQQLQSQQQQQEKNEIIIRNEDKPVVIKQLTQQLMNNIPGVTNGITGSSRSSRNNSDSDIGHFDEEESGSNSKLEMSMNWLSSMDEVMKARLLLLCAAALYGTNFSFVKILGETDMSIGFSATLRFGLAAVVTLPWLLHVEDKEEDRDSTITTTIATSREESITKTSPAWQKGISSWWNTLTDPSGEEWKSTVAGLEVGFWVCLGYIFQAIGLETTSASESAFLCSLAVVIVPILDVLIGKQLLPRQMLGAIMAVVGVAFLELGGSAGSAAATATATEAISSSSSSWSQFLSSISYGDICSLVQPLAFGMGFWRMEHAMHEYPNQANRSTGAQLLAVFIGSAVYLAFSSPAAADISSTMLSSQQSPIENLFQTVASMDPLILFSLFWTGVITTALTVYMETLALKTLSAAETTIIFSTEPLWGTAFAAVMMGERLGINAAMGASLIMAGCLFSNLGIDGLRSFLLPTTATSTTTTSSAVTGDHYGHDDDNMIINNNNSYDNWKTQLVASCTACYASVLVFLSNTIPFAPTSTTNAASASETTIQQTTADLVEMEDLLEQIADSADMFG